MHDMADFDWCSSPKPYDLKETRFRLRVLRRCGFLTASHDPVIRESHELIRIVAAVIRNADADR
jgi:hypothetical protein